MLSSAQTLQAAGLNSKMYDVKTLSILDVGFGCGDQCLYFKHLLNDQESGKLNAHARLQAYVGITLEGAQFSIAEKRLGYHQSDEASNLHIFAADAGQPETWTSQIRERVSAAFSLAGANAEHSNWLLALDTLYHFQPTRWPIIHYANTALNASLMAFDLCVAEDLSLRQRLVLRLLSVFGQTPYSNWVTITEYRRGLVAAGYATEKIEIRDISEDVFGPLAVFLKRREVEARLYGLSAGRFRYAAKMFAWWARSGVVKGCIVVARK